MKKTLLTTTFLMTLASTAALAHHPAADIVDPEIYAMIDENVADTPHAELTFDDMGNDMDEVGAAAAEALEERGEMDEVVAATEALEERGEMDNVRGDLARGR